MSDISASSKEIIDFNASLLALAGSAHHETHKIAAHLHQINYEFYKDVKRQAEQSFETAKHAAIVGGLFFLLAAAIAIFSDTAFNNVGPSISLIAGTIIEIISALNFVLYAKATRQFDTFHICLERTTRFLLSNTLCESLKNPDEQDKMRSELITIIAKASILPVGTNSIFKEKKSITQVPSN